MDQPILGVSGQQRVDGEDKLRIPLAAEHEQTEIGFVQPQMQQRIVEFPRHCQRPEGVPSGMNSGKVNRHVVRSEQPDRCPPARPVRYCNAHVAIIDRVGG